MDFDSYSETYLSTTKEWRQLIWLKQVLIKILSSSKKELLVIVPRALASCFIYHTYWGLIILLHLHSTTKSIYTHTHTQHIILTLRLILIIGNEWEESTKFQWATANIAKHFFLFKNKNLAKYIGIEREEFKLQFDHYSLACDYLRSH